MNGKDLAGDAARIIDTCTRRGLKVASAESCTGGLVMAHLTAIPGSSAVVDRGFVTYSNEAKTAMLGVPARLIESEGAVSEPVALAMAKGAIANSLADIAVAITGIAGPGGGSPSKPVGLVHLAAAGRDGRTVHRKEIFTGDRQAVRLASVKVALGLIESLAES